MIDITIDRESDTPLYAQIRESLQTAIEKKELKPGQQLPPVTALAKNLGVTQTTIRRAFKDLRETGSVGCHVGRGTFVLDPDNPENRGEPAAVEPERSQTGAGYVDPDFLMVARRLRMGIEKSLDTLTVLTQRPGLIHFTSGVPDPTISEEGILEELAGEAFKTDPHIYQNTCPPPGLLDLRKEVAARYSRSGVEISPDQVMITNGSQQAVSIMAQYALENKQRVICETPCYMGIPKAFGAVGHWVESIPRDEKGPIPERLNRFRDGKPSLFYLCPKLHNPMGTDVSPERRALLREWAEDQNALLVADEIFHDLYFEKTGPESFLSDFGSERTVAIGSFSKSFMTGIRIGWMITSKERIRTMAALKRAMDIGSPSLMQGIALALVRTNAYENHLQKAKEHYRIRRDAMIKALDRYMPKGVTWTRPEGGFHMWVTLPKGYSSIVLFLLAIERGVAFFPGPQMDIDHRFVNAFRFSYGSVDLDRIQEGVELLADAVRELLKAPPNDPGLSGLGDFA